jgi:hypothetical protein
MSEKFTYSVISPIWHGRFFAIGDLITLSEIEAKTLVKCIDLESAIDPDPEMLPGKILIQAGGKIDDALENNNFTARIAELESSLVNAESELTRCIDDSAEAVDRLNQTIIDLNSTLAERESDLDELTKDNEALKLEIEKLKAAKPVKPPASK